MKLSIISKFLLLIISFLVCSACDLSYKDDSYLYDLEVKESSKNTSYSYVVKIKNNNNYMLYLNYIMSENNKSLWGLGLETLKEKGDAGNIRGNIIILNNENNKEIFHVDNYMIRVHHYNSWSDAQPTIALKMYPKYIYLDKGEYRINIFLYKVPNVNSFHKKQFELTNLYQSK